MGFRRTFLAKIFQAPLLGVLIGSTPVAVHAGPPESFVAGDLIVKFTDASATGTTVARAMYAEKVADQELLVIAKRLSDELGVALTFARLTSGRELVLSVERDQLLQAQAQRLKRNPAVRTVAPVAAPKTVLPSEQITLTVEYAPGSEEQKLLRAAQAGADSAEIQRLVAKLTAGAYPQPVGKVRNDGQLVLSIDMASLTRDLVSQLRRRPDVEYAQVSHVFRPFDSGKKK